MSVVAFQLYIYVNWYYVRRICVCMLARMYICARVLYVYLCACRFSLISFHDISTIVGYLMLTPFYTYEQFYFKQFSLAYVYSLVLFDPYRGPY